MKSSPEVSAYLDQLPSFPRISMEGSPTRPQHSGPFSVVRQLEGVNSAVLDACSLIDLPAGVINRFMGRGIIHGSREENL